MGRDLVIVSVNGKPVTITGDVNTSAKYHQTVSLAFSAQNEASIRKNICDNQDPSYDCLIASAPLTITYTENNTWAVVVASPPNLDKGTTVLKLAGGTYNVVAGPGTDLELKSGDVPDSVLKLVQRN